MSNEIKWIKISTNIFSDEKVKMIKSLPGGKDILLVWFQLLALAGRTNNAGMIYFTPQMPYTEDMLAISFDESNATIKMALTTFVNFGMIEIDDNKIISIVNWEKHQNVEGMERVKKLNAERNKRYRERKKNQLLLGHDESNVTSNVTHDVTLTSHDALDIDIELDKELINNKKIYAKKSYAEFVQMTEIEYNKLAQKFGKSQLDDCIERLDEWQTNQKPNKRKVDHYKTLNNWLKKDVNKQPTTRRVDKPLIIE